MKHTLYNAFKLTGLVCLVLISGAVVTFAQTNSKQTVAIEWIGDRPEGSIKVLNATLVKIAIAKGKGNVKKQNFALSNSGPARITLDIEGVKNAAGPGATIVKVNTRRGPFSFFLRDVNKQHPIYLPANGAVVLTGTDQRTYKEIEGVIKSRDFKSKLQIIENEPEESFDFAAKHTIEQTAPTILGLSRDFRVFQYDENFMNNATSSITPKLSSSPLMIPEERIGVAYAFCVGRGVGVSPGGTRRLEDGVLPIINSTLTDDDVTYHSTSFVALEHTPLTGSTVKGTHYLVADNHSAGHMLTKEQMEVLKPELPKALKTAEQPVLYFRCTATNNGNVLRYAWFKTVKPGVGWWHKSKYTMDPLTGFSAYARDTVMAVSKLNGKPLPNEEIAVLLQPGEKVNFEFYLPHSPVTEQQAVVLAKQNFDTKLLECKTFWNTKLKKGAKIKVPEQRIDEMIKAGMLHLDLVTYGKEPDSTLAPTIGVYSPIGTESAPIIQTYASMGWFDIARRSLNYFLDKQHEDGLIQNFGGYMVETGAALWSMGEYYRYSKDKKWIIKIKPKLLKSCDYLIKWRNDNKKEELRGKGYGMIAGKVADPEDHFHQFMLNGYAYLGIARIAEVLSDIDPVAALRLKKEAESWKTDIRTSFFNAMANSPVVPLGDGSWCATAPPWTEATGPRALYEKAETFWSHGTFTAPDAMLGPLYLVFCEVLDVKEPVSKSMLDYHSELFYQQNAAFSQPYYSRHNWLQAKLGMVKPFLKTYYNSFAALADRQTYTFWEHIFHASPHKTHEEAWFLMETRWMLYMEEGNALHLLKTIPRAWMEDGKEIILEDVQSYFGKIRLKTHSNVNNGYIDAEIECTEDRKPGTVTLRLPHPEHKTPVRISGGKYDPATETVTIDAFTGKAVIKLEF